MIVVLSCEDIKPGPGASRSDLEDQVVDVHLLLLLHDVDDQAVDVVPLPLQCAGRVLVHVQVRLSGQQLDGRGNALQTARRHLLVQPQHT